MSLNLYDSDSGDLRTYQPFEVDIDGAAGTDSNGVLILPPSTRVDFLFDIGPSRQFGTLIDQSTGEMLSLGIDPATPTMLRDIDWQVNAGASPVITLAIPEERFGHAFVLMSGSGSLFPVSSDALLGYTRGDGSGLFQSYGFFTAQATLDNVTGREGLWLVDVSTNEQIPAGIDYLASSNWSSLNAPAILRSLVIRVPDADASSLFTLHSSSGFQQSVQPSWGSGGLSVPGTGGVIAYSGQIVSAVAGIGDVIWLTRDSDGLASPRVQIGALDQFVDWSESFPQPPTANFQTYSFQVGQVRAGHALGVRQADGTEVFLSASSPPGNYLVTWDDNGQELRYYYDEYIAVLDSNQAWNLIDGSTGENLGNTTSVLDGWQPWHPTPPQGWLALTLNNARKNDQFRLRQEDGTAWNVVINPDYTDPWSHLSAWNFFYSGEADAGSYEIAYVPASAPYNPYQSFSIEDITTGEVTMGSDLSNWLPSPSPLSLKMPLSRWTHELWLHQSNGARYLLNKGNSQGSWSQIGSGRAWFTSYGYFDAFTSYHPETDWWIFDASSNEISALNQTDLVAWNSIEDSRDSDHDGLADWYELASGTNPNSADSDGDGISDEDEVNVTHTNPNAKDSDGDGVDDLQDAYPLDPRRSGDLPVISYVAVDVSSSANNQQDVEHVALNDNNQVGFAWPDPNGLYYSSAIWRAGQIVQAQSLPHWRHVGLKVFPLRDDDDETGTPIIADQWVAYDPVGVNGNGVLAGNMSAIAFLFADRDDGEDIESVGLLDATNPNIPDGKSYGTFLGSVPGHGAFAWGQGAPPAADLIRDGSLYYDFIPPSAVGITNQGILHGILSDEGSYSFINNTQFGVKDSRFKYDSAISNNGTAAGKLWCDQSDAGSEYTTTGVWNGVFYPIFENDNNQTLVLAVNDWAEVFGFSERLNPSAWTPHPEPRALHPFFFTNGAVVDFYSMLPAKLKNQIAFFPGDEIQPIFNPAGDLLFKAQIATGTSEQPAWRPACLVWQRSRDGKDATLSEVQLPEGFQPQGDANTLNSSLLICGLQWKPVLGAAGQPVGNPNSPTQPLQTRRAILAMPVSLVDAKTPDAGGDDVTVSTKFDDQDKLTKGIAWIEPHAGKMNGPEMPHLVLQSRALETGGVRVKWKLTVNYDRPLGNNPDKARVLAQDSVRIPADGSWRQTAEPGVVAIYNDPDWIAELSNKGFFGGEADLAFQFVTADGKPIDQLRHFLFRVGGKNPNPVICERYITEVCANLDSRLRFSYAMAKHESKDYNDLPKGRSNTRYNQFWENEGKRFGVNHRIGDPLWCKAPYEQSAGGFGIFQITGRARDDIRIDASGKSNRIDGTFYNVSREVFWNWQKGVDAYLGIMKNEGPTSKLAVSDRFFSGIAKRYQGDKRYEQSPLNCSSVPGVTFAISAEEASCITLYNGAPGSQKSKIVRPSGKVGFITNPWTFDPMFPVGQKWIYHANRENYLHKVIIEAR